MTDEQKVEEQEQQVAVSEQPEVQAADEEQQKMVPLSALEAERRKRQEAEAKAQAYQEFAMREPKQDAVEQEDPNALVEKHVLHQNTAASERRILETLYQDMNPKAVLEINKYLKPILEKKPWLAQTVDAAQNRYARAYEIVQDYMHLVEEKPAARQSSISDTQRLVQNSQKPRSPVEVGKSAQPKGIEFLKSIQGKQEFREYRQKVLRGET